MSTCILGGSSVLDAGSWPTKRLDRGSGGPYIEVTIVANKGPKTGIFSRSSKILNMAAKVAGHEVRHTVKKTINRSVDALASDSLKTKIRQAQIITENLSQLKGAMMKAGQLLSIDATDYLPPEAIEILGRLQADAEPVDFEVIRQVLEKELGDKLTRLEDLSPDPVASASIGQVHRARFEGTPVAVKVQYPGIADSIESDVKMLHRLSQSWLSLTGKKIDLAGLFEEMKTLLLQEADYLTEAKHLEEYRRLLSAEHRFVVPTAFRDVSSQRVLTMSWEEGPTMRNWLSSNPSYADREWLGRTILDLYCLEFFEWGFVQTDPNPSNFLVRGPERQIVLLDLGAAMRYDEAFRANYVQLLAVMGTGDRNAIIQAGIDFDLIDARESDKSLNLFADLMEAALVPFTPGLQPFVFQDADYAKEARQIGQTFAQSLKYSSPPRTLLFLHRKLGGIFNILRRLDLKLDLLPYWDKMVGAEIHAA